MEKKAADALEVAAQANEKREKAEKTAQGKVKIILRIRIFIYQNLCKENTNIVVR